MSTVAPNSPNELRPLLHRRIDDLPDAELALLHRVMLELERDRLLSVLNDEFDKDRDAGRLRHLPRRHWSRRRGLG